MTTSESVYGPYGTGEGTPGAPHSATLDRVASGPEQPRMRMRQRLARFGQANRTPQSAVLDPLFAVVKANHPKTNLEELERAYHTAEHYHRGQTRKSGEPYITHPLAVATILAELGMTSSTLCAALLHDTVEDTSYTIDQLRADFGEEIALLVDGVTKLDKLTYGESAKAETIRKLVVATAKDVRVLIIKLGDRLHNMRTLSFLRPDKQRRIAHDTLEIFAPLAHRLGMNAIKWELEDLSFATLQPKVYDEIVRMVAEAAPQRERQLREVIDQAKRDLHEAGIKATVYGRPKHYYSIYQKMVVRGREFTDIYDLVGLRVLVDTTRDCYGALGVLHTRWNPLPGRFKDYIALPKYNMYQSLHTTVLGPGNRPVEFQIRTQDMHRRAEYGVAAHWKYKEEPRNGAAKGAPTSEAAPDDTQLGWVHQLNQWQRETEDPGEFLDSLRFELNTSEVYVFTPKGDVIALPQGSTPVDLAYAIHTQVGDRCIGARVNGRLVALDSQLANGDICEILVSRAENAGPSRDWLSFVASQRARSKIKQHFTRERREEAIEQGKDLLARQLRKSSLPLQRLLTVEHLTAVADAHRLPDINALYAAIGEGNVSAQSVVHRLLETEGGVEEAATEGLEDKRIHSAPSRKARANNDVGIIVAGDSDMWVKLAKCCTPLPGDEILGFVTRENGVSVHRRDCTNAANLLSQPERIVDVEWDSSRGTGYLVAIQVEALDRTGLLSELTKTIGDQGLSITSALVSTTKDRLAKVRLTFECSDPKHLAEVIAQLRKVSGVYDVDRVSQGG